MFTLKSPLVESETLRLEPAAGVIPTAPVEISEGVETEVEDKSLVAESVSVAKVRSESSVKRPLVVAKETRPEVRLLPSVSTKPFLAAPVVIVI